MTNLSGHSLGRYHLIEQLGEGGMATVYKSYDTRLEREVAIKIIRQDAFPANALAEIIKRFEREAKSLAKLSHPNIVKIHDYGEYEDAPYLVMEYLPGGTLKKLLGTPIPWQEALHLLLPIARGVAYAHQRGILHRDIKPANILITESGEPMLSDFGIAKLFEGEQTTTLTGSGMAIGTPEYMAPEQWTGETTPQSDLYSLGVVFFEMITGRKPYIADTPAAVLLKQATEPLPRPGQFVSNLPESVELLLIKSLARDPQDRYKDVNALIAAMEELISNSITTTQPEIVRKGSTATVKQEGSQTVYPPEPTQRQLAPTQKTPTKTLPRFSQRTIFVGGAAVLLLLVLSFGFSQGWFLPASPPLITGTPTEALPTLAPTQATALEMPPATETPASSPTEMPTNVPTSIPFAWTRLNSLQDFPLDGVKSIVVNPIDQDIIYAGTLSAGIYKSLNGGKSWEASSSGLERAQIEQLALDSQLPDILIANTFPGEVFRSVNGGQSWLPTIENYSPNYVLEDEWNNRWIGATLIQDPRNSQHVFILASGGWYETHDSGKSWERKEISCPDYPTALTFHPTDPNLYFLTGSNQANQTANCKAGIYQYDAAQEAVEPVWLLSQDDIDQEKTVSVLSVDLEKNILFASGSRYLVISRNGGKTWESVDSYGCKWFVNNPGMGTLGYCDTGPYISLRVTQSGQYWVNISSPVSETILGLGIMPGKPQTLLLGTASLGLFISTNSGGSWKQISNGLPVGHFDLHVSKADDTRLFLVKSNCDSQSPIYMSQDSGRNWQLSTDKGCGFAQSADGKTLYRGQLDSFLVSLDGGKGWTFNTRVPNPKNEYPMLAAAHPTDANHAIAVTTILETRTAILNSGVNQTLSPYTTYYSLLNRGAELKALNQPHTDTHFLRNLVYAPSSVNTLYSISTQNELLLSKDEGQSWTNCGAMDTFTADSDSTLIVHPQDAQKLYLATLGKGIQYSADGCQTWTAMNNGLQNLFVNSIAMDPNEPNTLYAGTDNGAYVTFDGGHSWGAISQGLTANQVVYSIAIDSRSKVYAVTPAGIYVLQGK